MENRFIPEGWESLIAKMANRTGADDTKPAWTYGDFLATAQQVFIAKSTDYEDRYLKALINLDARTIWAWEVNKKLDRLRTWIKRGELQVKGEGIRNSIDDLFIYTVQYFAYVQQVINYKQGVDSFLRGVQNDRANFFWTFAQRLRASEWVEFLEIKGLIEQDELLLKNILRGYMGDHVTVSEWQDAIRKILA